MKVKAVAGGLEKRFEKCLKEAAKGLEKGLKGLQGGLRREGG